MSSLNPAYRPIRVRGSFLAPKGRSGGSDVTNESEPIFQFEIEHWLAWSTEEYVRGLGFTQVDKESDRQRTTVYAENRDQAEQKIEAAHPSPPNKVRQFSVISFNEVRSAD